MRKEGDHGRRQRKGGGVYPKMLCPSLIEDLQDTPQVPWHRPREKVLTTVEYGVSDSLVPPSVDEEDENLLELECLAR